MNKWKVFAVTLLVILCILLPITITRSQNLLSLREVLNKVFDRGNNRLMVDPWAGPSAQEVFLTETEIFNRVYDVPNNRLITSGGGGGGSSNWADLLSGTNTSGIFVLDTGSALSTTGSATIAATTSLVADALTTNGTNCAATEASTGTDASGNAEGCFTPGTTSSAFNALTSGVNTTAAMTVGTGASLGVSDSGTITATGASTNPGNCSAGLLAAGIDAAFIAEGCIDVATQTELDTHAALTTAHGSVSTNTASRIVQRDASGNFAAGTITAGVTGNASTATALGANGANCSVGQAAIGVDASGASEGCFNPVRKYAFAVAAQTSVTIPGATHGLATDDVQVQCWTGATPRVKEEAGWTVHPSTFEVVVTFGVAFTGRCNIQG